MLEEGRLKFDTHSVEVDTQLPYILPYIYLMLVTKF